MLEEGLSIAEIAARRGLKEAPSTVTAPTHLRADSALHEQRASGEPRLKAVFERFEGRYDYGVLKCVAAALSREDEAHGSG